MVATTLCIFSERPNLAVQSIAPDNTPSIKTKAAENCIIANIERNSIGSLRSTVDDLLINLHVAVKTIDCVETHLEQYLTNGENTTKNYE